MKTIIRPTTVATVQAAAELTQKHWQEVALNKAVPLDVDWRRYQDLETADDLFCVGVFDDHDGLVGYTVNFLFFHPHYRTVLMCQNDALFLSPGHRGGHLGVQLMNFTVARAKERGCKRMLWHAKKGKALDRMLDASSDYIVQDIIYSKEL